MRLLLKLKAVNDFAYDYKYYHKLQGWLYSLLKNTFYKDLHDKKGEKYFCFSNIFPPPRTQMDVIKENQIKNLLISSPNNNLIHVLWKKIKKTNFLNIGEMHFLLENITKITTQINDNIIIDTKTPILLRTKNNQYWNPKKGDDFAPFLLSLEENLRKKYEKFYGIKLKEEPFFENFKFIDSVVNHLILNKKEAKVYGSLWNFGFTSLTRTQKELLRFSFDAGFGERNSYGFGFVDLKRN